MQGSRHIILAAGGTGGHMVPAHALSLVLMRQGFEVSLLTDTRGQSYSGLFAGVPKHVLPVAQIKPGKPTTWLSGLRTLWQSRQAARQLFKSYTPALVLGFGGYPCVPALWAALGLGIPTALHEQNAVLGRVNRYFASKVALLATSYPQTRLLPKAARAKTVYTGNPVRAEIEALRAEPFPDFNQEGAFRVLVVGGSQGASILSDVVPSALALLPAHVRARLQVTQQCRPDDIAMVRQIYAEQGIAASLATYIEDMATELAWAHLVIARAGASTLAELTSVGRPAILVPLPTATDNHQTHNARHMVEAGGARMIAQHAFTPAELARQIQKIALGPGSLINAAKRARQSGVPRAAERLAQEINRVLGWPVDTPRAAPPLQRSLP
jgi:UDP-N-acetylglucosamine--N-acetylmuramyl-(pentapeptide) pyrophosphoryl-undecaprenol N-acetylglucosamine transferase